MLCDNWGLVSVIVPIYKVEKYLNKCVDSLLKQTYKNLEIILVDDGSPDNCGKICDRYKEKDKRIKVIHKTNGGLSDARNIGVDYSTGDFISFIDSDDFVSPIFVERMLNAMVKTGADIVSTDYNIARFIDLDEETVRLDEEYDETNTSVLTVDEALRLLLYQRIPNGAPFRLYRRYVFNELVFPCGIIFEDVAIVHKLFMKVNRIALVHEKMYAYRLRKDGIVRSGFSLDKMVVVSITRNLYEDIVNYNPELKKAACSRAFAQNFHVFLQIPAEYKQEKCIVFEELKKYRMMVIIDENKNVRVKNRIGAFISLLGPDISMMLGKVYKKFSAK